ncbi:hypothetical protein CBS101457_000268 [Exobasidium rhododendri]|nr:hypothetical protein CBS101457_000268 [Exobasidium rhododendri]
MYGAGNDAFHSHTDHSHLRRLETQAREAAFPGGRSGGASEALSARAGSYYTDTAWQAGGSTSRLADSHGVSVGQHGHTDASSWNQMPDYALPDYGSSLQYGDHNVYADMFHDPAQLGPTFHGESSQPFLHTEYQHANDAFGVPFPHQFDTQISLEESPPLYGHSDSGFGSDIYAHQREGVYDPNYDAPSQYLPFDISEYDSYTMEPSSSLLDHGQTHSLGQPYQNLSPLHNDQSSMQSYSGYVEHANGTEEQLQAPGVHHNTSDDHLSLAPPSGGPEIFTHMGKERREALYAVVNRRRGIRSDTTRKHFTKKLTEADEQALLSNDVNVVDAALARLIPLTLRNRLPDWMSGLTAEEEKALVQKGMLYSGQSEELVRTYYTSSSLSSRSAKHLLASDEAAWIAYIAASGLSTNSNKEYKNGKKRYVAVSIGPFPWQVDVPPSKRRQIVKHVRSMFGVTEHVAYQILREPHVYPGFGRDVLNADEGRDAVLMAHLRSGSAIMRKRDFAWKMSYRSRTNV